MSLSVGNIAEFIVSVIIVKGIIAHYLIDLINKGLHKWFGTTERKTAIWLHYKHRALGEGHQNDNVVSCGEGNCRQFA